ncbi:MAG: hypothetical protein ACR2L1_07815 [Pyrinomonadaceae bacterium]
MKKEDAIKILEDKLNEYRKLSYAELVEKEKVGEPETFEGKNETDENYQIEVEFFFDDAKENTLRVQGIISYSFCTDFSPICSDFIIATDGSFIDE